MYFWTNAGLNHVGGTVLQNPALPMFGVDVQYKLGYFIQ